MTSTAQSTAVESRLLIDGKLVESSSGKTCPNVNPATEETLGEVQDASPDDVRNAISAARRAFDETTWSEDHAFRRRCLEQLHAAMDRMKEELRSALVLETGCPVMLTHVVQIEVPMGDIAYWSEQATAYQYEQFLDDREAMGGTAA
jgi:aldehyde dehydrogenase (NAD+)